MSIRCPNCGSFSCVISAERVLDIASTLYTKCRACCDLTLLKTSKIDLSGMDFGDFRCTECGRSPLDAVMAHVLAISTAHKERHALSLREVGTPLLSPGVPTNAPPHIGYHNLLLLTNQILIADASDEILREVPEVAGVIFGDAKRVIGLAHTSARPYTCRLLAGCDTRADMIASAYGELLIYKSQSKIHIEHNNTAKMAKLGALPIAGRVVLDGLAGPGSLGLMSSLMGAQKVILNDAWLPAVENAFLNLRVNREMLGIRKIERASMTNRGSRNTPQLFCTATTKHGIIELFHGDFHAFNIRDSEAEIVLLDPFPGEEGQFRAIDEEVRKNNPKADIIYF